MANAKHEGFVDDGYDSDVRDEQRELADAAMTPVAEKHVTFLKRTTEPITGNWQISGNFDHSGGILQSYLSDDYLKIPRGAIPKGQQWAIYGRIHTELDNTFDYLLNKSKGECFASAISEYEVEGGHWFDEPVAVVVHPSKNSLSKLDQLAVQLHSEHHGFIEVPRDKGVDEKGPWFEVEGSTITVYTYHFTKITCKICDAEECRVEAIKGLVFGKITTDAENNFFAMIEVYIHLVRSSKTLPVFYEMFNQQLESAGCKLLNAKTFPPTLRQIASADKISVNLHCTQADWNLLEDSDFQEKEMIVGDHVPCLTEAYDPVCLGTYLLKGSSRILNGNITLIIGNSTVKLPVTLEIPGATIVDEQVAIPPADWILQDTTLYTIAKTLKPEAWFEVGLKLGLMAYVLDQIGENNSHQSVERKMFTMLRCWRDRQLQNGEHELQSIETLRYVLRSTGNNCALELLEESCYSKTSKSNSSGTSKSGKGNTLSYRESVLGTSSGLHIARDHDVTCYHVTKDHDHIVTDSTPDQDQVNAATLGNDLTITTDQNSLTTVGQSITVTPHQDRDSTTASDQNSTATSYQNRDSVPTLDQNSSVTSDQDQDPATISDQNSSATSDQNSTVTPDQDQGSVTGPNQNPAITPDQDQDPNTILDQNSSLTSNQNFSVTPHQDQDSTSAPDQNSTVASYQDGDLTPTSGQNPIVTPDQYPNLALDHDQDSLITTQDHDPFNNSTLNQVKPFATNEVAPATTFQVHAVTQVAVSASETNQQLSHSVLHNSQDNCKLDELLHLEGIEARYQDLIVSLSKALAKWSQAAPQVVICNFNNGPMVAASARERQMAIPTAKWKILTPANLYEIAEAMPHNSFFPVGFYLNIDNSILNTIRTEYKEESDAIRNQQMLWTWREQNNAVQESELVEKLCCAFGIAATYKPLLWKTLEKVGRLLGAKNVPGRLCITASTVDQMGQDS